MGGGGDVAAHGLVKWEGPVGDKFFMERSGMKDAGYNGRVEGALATEFPATYHLPQRIISKKRR